MATVKGENMSRLRKGQKAKPKSHSHKVEWSRLSAIALENFKRFPKLPPVHLKPLTFITGPNSSGKSSFIQGLVLLKQSLEATTAVGQLVFDDLVKLGSFDRVVCDQADEPKTTFSVCIYLSLQGHEADCRRDLGKAYSATRILFSFAKESRSDDLCANAVLHALDLDLVNEDGSIEPFLRFERPNISSQVDDVEYLVKKKSEWFTKPFKGDLRVSNGRRWKPEARTIFHAAFEGLLPVALETTVRRATKKSTTKGTDRMPVSTTVRLPLSIPNPFVGFAVRNARLALTNGLFYVGPLRVEPQFIYAQTSKRIGVRGEDAISYLRANRSLRVHQGTPTRKCKELHACVDQWLKHLHICEGMHFQEHGDIYFEPLAGKRHLPEVGCGVGQILPLIIECLAALPGSTVLLEQPEIHLHQSLQAGLCDFLLVQMQRGVRIVVETHSEIMIQRLRRRIAEDKKGDLHGLCKVLFVGMASTAFVDVGIDSVGNVSSWPDMFFDQGIQEMKALAEAQASRDVAERGADNED